MPERIRVRTVGSHLPPQAGQDVVALHAHPVAPAHEQIDDRVCGVDAATANGFSEGVLESDFEALLAVADDRDLAAFTTLIARFDNEYRRKMHRELIRHLEFEGLPIAMQQILAPDSPFHQESRVDASGLISCTTAVRVEGVGLEDARIAICATDWSKWWATSTTSGPPPTFDFVPEAPLKVVSGFHLTIKLDRSVADGPNYRVPVKLVGTVTGDAEIHIEAVDGGVVIHDTWIDARLSNDTMEHFGGVKFWTGGHLDSLRGAALGGVLGATGFASTCRAAEGSPTRAAPVRVTGCCGRPPRDTRRRPQEPACTSSGPASCRSSRCTS